MRGYIPIFWRKSIWTKN